MPLNCGKFHHNPNNTILSIKLYTGVVIFYFVSRGFAMFKLKIILFVTQL